MPRLTPMNSAGPEMRAALAAQFAALDPSIIQGLQAYWSAQPDAYTAWTNPQFSGLLNAFQTSHVGGEGYSPNYSQTWGSEQGYQGGNMGITPDQFSWAFNPTTLSDGSEQGTAGYALNPNAGNAVIGAPGSGRDFIPMDFVRRHEAEYRAIDPSFNLETLARQQHPVMGDVVLMGDLPQLDQTNGEMFQEMLMAAAGVAAGAMGISAFAGAHGLPGISSLLEFGTSGIQSAAQSSGTTAAQMLAEESRQLIAAGFTPEEVASSLAGLGDQAQITSILTNAGIDAAEASSLAQDVISNSSTGGGTSGGGDGSTVDTSGSTTGGSTPGGGTSGGGASDGTSTGGGTSGGGSGGGGTSGGSTSGGGSGGGGTSGGSTSYPQWVTDLATSLGISPRVLSGILGAAGGSILGAVGGSEEAGQITVTNNPWAPVVPYLNDALSTAEGLYNRTNQLTPEAQSVLDTADNYYGNAINNPLSDRVNNLVGNMIGPDGSVNSLFDRIPGVSAPTITPAQMQAASFNFQDAMSGLGEADPTTALSGLLSGKVDNPHLDSIANNITGLATRNLLENVMPAIGSGAAAAGQYGGSRQGIAQGVAASRMNQDLGSSLSNLYGSAYENALNRMGTAANSMATLGTNIGATNAGWQQQANANNAGWQQQANIQNANNQLSANQFNANLGLAQNQFDLSSMNSGMNWANTANNMQNQNFSNALNTANYGQDRQWQQLNNYSGLLNNVAGRGGSTSQPYFNNPYSSILGGAVSGASLANNIFGS